MRTISALIYLFHNTECLVILAISILCYYPHGYIYILILLYLRKAPFSYSKNRHRFDSIFQYHDLFIFPIRQNFCFCRSGHRSNSDWNLRKMRLDWIFGNFIQFNFCGSVGLLVVNDFDIASWNQLAQWFQFEMTVGSSKIGIMINH